MDIASDGYEGYQSYDGYDGPVDEVRSETILTVPPSWSQTGRAAALQVGLPNVATVPCMRKR